MGQKGHKENGEEELKNRVALVRAYEMSLMPEREELAERYHMPDGFYESLERKIRKQEKKKRWRTARRTVAAAAAVVLCVGVLQSRTLAQAAEWVIRCFNDHISYQFRKNTQVNWVPRYELGYIPDGYEISLDDYSAPGGMIMYHNVQGGWLALDYGVIDGSLDVDNENKDFLILTGSRGETIYYLRAQKPGDESSITWVSGDKTTKFNLIGDLPEDELLKIQEGIYTAEDVENEQ